jgi:hypothetical protein
MLRERPTLPPVRRPSRVRPTAEAANPVTYTFQSEVRASHVGRYLVLILFILTLAVVGWQRRDLRTLASRFSNGPPPSRSKVTNAPPAPVPVSPATVLTPQNADPEPSALVSKHSQSAAGKTSSQVPSQEGSVAADTPSKAENDPVSANPPARETLETEGEKYLYGDDAPANCDRAQKELLAAAEHSSAKAQSALGTIYATGHCAIRDLPLAYRWFARAQRQDPHNRVIEQDMRVLWDQMSPEERMLATR